MYLFCPLINEITVPPAFYFNIYSYDVNLS